MAKGHICFCGLVGDTHDENYHIGIHNGLNDCKIL